MPPKPTANAIPTRAPIAKLSRQQAVNASLNVSKRVLCSSRSSFLKHIFSASSNLCFNSMIMLSFVVQLSS